LFCLAIHLADTYIQILFGFVLSSYSVSRHFDPAFYCCCFALLWEKGSGIKWSKIM